MSEKPILFSGPMVRAILDGRKTQTRRILNPQPEIMYRLTDDRIYAIHSNNSKWRCYCERHSTGQWRVAETHPCVSKCGLHGWIGRTDILSYSLCWLWEKGLRGLVSASRIKDKEGIPVDIDVPRKQEGDKECPQTCVYGVPWDANTCHAANETLRRQPGERQADKPEMGNSGRKLEGQEGPREGNGRGKAPDGEIVGRGIGTLEVGRRYGFMLPKARGKNAWDVSGWRISRCKYEIGQTLWVRETWLTDYDFDSFKPSEIPTNAPIEYSATDLPFHLGKTRPSIFMCRWMSRTDLLIKDVRVERLQDISEDDAEAEGCNKEWYNDNAGTENLWPCPTCDGFAVHGALGTNYGVTEVDCDDCNTSIKMFRSLWDSINGKKHPWESNPWVWVVEFEINTH